jgi:hypothetical protein
MSIIPLRAMFFVRLYPSWWRRDGVVPKDFDLTRAMYFGSGIFGVTAIRYRDTQGDRGDPVLGCIRGLQILPVSSGGETVK